MKKKNWKKLTASVLAVIMTFSLAACGNTEQPQSTGATTPTSETVKDTEPAQEPAQQEEEISGEFSYFGPIWNPYKESTPIFDELMARTGVTVNFEWADEANQETLLASKVASQDLPDVISGGTATPGAIDDLIRQGLIVPITDYLEDGLENYGRMLTDEDRMFLTNEEDGEIYGFGLVMDVPPAHSTIIRTDWLERVNMEMPTTWDEWVAVWKAFKEQDANGNGNPNDEVPFGFNYDMMKYILAVFGMETNGVFSVVDGEYLYDPENPNYELFLDEMRALYEQGLIPQEMVTLKGADFNTLGASNTLGSLVGYAEYSKNYTIACRELDETAFFQCVVPIVGPTGAQNIPARAKVGASAYITVKAIENGNLSSILKFFNYVYSDEGIELTNYGIEGEYFEKVDGTPTLKAPYNEGFSVARENGLIPSTIPFCFTEDLYMQILTNGLSYDELEDSGQTFMDGMTINGPYYYSEPLLIKTESYVDCFDLLEQQTALRDRYIMGQINKDEYTSEYQKLKDAGLTQMIEDSREAYARLAK